MSKTQLNKESEKTIVNQKINQRVISTNEKTTIELEPGKIATTLQGGLETPIGFKEVLAGEYVKEWKLTNITRMLTPAVPTMDKLHLKISAWFVPHTRVWEDAEKYLANKENLENRNTNIINKRIPYVDLSEITPNPTNQWLWKASLLSKYGYGNNATNLNEVNMLLPRGYRAIQNDFLRIKEYELPLTEWNTSGKINNTERDALYINESDFLIEANPTNPNFYGLAPAKARKGYLNNLKRNMITAESAILSDYIDVYEHLDWQNKYNDEKQRIDNAEKNDWDIIAEMGGTQPVKADRVQLLGQIEYELNYQQITQSAPEINNSTPLGTTGSFSYTRGDGILFNHKKFEQHGFIHILASISMDNVIESSIPKELLKHTTEEIYRPGLAQKETQTLYSAELRGTGTKNPVAYQPAWAEYKRIPSFASGEMQTATLTKLVAGTDTLTSVTNSQWHNMLQYPSLTITENYFKPAKVINTVLARNNLVAQLPSGAFTTKLNSYGIFFENDPIMNITEHRVKASLPIPHKIITSTEKAESER